MAFIAANNATTPKTKNRTPYINFNLFTTSPLQVTISVYYNTEIHVLKLFHLYKKHEKNHSHDIILLVYAAIQAVLLTEKYKGERE